MEGWSPYLMTKTDWAVEAEVPSERYPGQTPGRRDKSQQEISLPAHPQVQGDLQRV